MTHPQPQSADASGRIGPEKVWSYRGYTLDAGNFTNAMVHLYRAEVTKINLWRSRLDTTTNWSVITTGAALTFAFGAPENPHFILLLVLLLMLAFLVIEARRYSYYVLWYHRVRLMETDFFATMITPPYHPPDDWGEALAQTLEEPSFLIPIWRGIANRYRRNYIWMITLVIVSWLLKLSIHPAPIESISEIVERAAISVWVPGPWVVVGVAALYLGLLALSLTIRLIQLPYGTKDSRPMGFRRSPKQPLERGRDQLAHIITSKPDLVAQRIIDELHRSATALEGRGMFSGTRRDVLLCALPARLQKRLKTLVQAVDPSAFIILTEAHDPRKLRFRPSTEGVPPEPPS
jgi:uncharacterized membrane protein